MSIQMFVPLPLLAALLLQLILSSPTSSFGLSPRRFWTPLRATGNAYESDEGNPGGFEGRGNAFEQFVQRVTGNADYNFGDVTRSVVNSTTHGVEDVVRTVTHDESYQFGDITKKAISSTTGGVEGLVKSVTGNEDYKFGDLTRGTINTAGGIVTYSGKSLSVLRQHNIHELIELMSIFWNQSMNAEERAEAFTVAVYLGSIVVLSYNFVANIMSGMIFAAAWAKVSIAAGSSPLSPGMWGTFIQVKSSLDWFFGGPCVPPRALITVPWFFVYRRMVVKITSQSPLKEKYPIVNRYMSLFVSWMVANVVFPGGVTFFMVKIFSLWTGVPVFPVAP